MAGFKGTFVVSWSQTEIDGLTGAPVAAIEAGVSWRWSGHAVRVDGPEDTAFHLDAANAEEIRTRAAQAVRRVLSVSLPAVRTRELASLDTPLLDRTFTVTDGRTAYTLTLVEAAELARPLVMMTGALPPENTDLWVVKGLEGEAKITQHTETPTGVICFTKGTLLNTPQGKRRVEDLAEGDEIDTKDGGPQSIVWIGKRQMTGARLYAMPELRPVRIRAGALGYEEPEPDLIVSPRHRVLLKGKIANALFNTPEVLVAAEDLINDRTVGRDYRWKSVEYVHLLLPRHHVVWANGVETESFHPAHTAFETIDPTQRTRLSKIIPGIEDDPHCYGPSARRELSRPETAILCNEGFSHG